MICSALGEVVVTDKTCKKWFQGFRNGDFDLSDPEKPDQPKTFEDEDWNNRGKSYSNGKRTCTRSRSYLASNFSSLASIRKNSKTKPMDKDTELICTPNNSAGYSFIY